MIQSYCSPFWFNIPLNRSSFSCVGGRLIFSARFYKSAWNQVFRNSFPKIGKVKMKLKFLPILAGSTLGWVLPPNNYTNPCEDFQLSRASLFKGKTIRLGLTIILIGWHRYPIRNRFENPLSVHETTHGEPECVELCRNNEKCVGFNFIKSKCFLKSSLGSELKLKLSISGKKFKPDYNGDPLKGTLGKPRTVL